jgi:hypothetical protein
VLPGRRWALTPQPLPLLQVGQYVSRAEELKAIVSSSSQALLRQGTTTRDLLRGRNPQPPSSLQRQVRVCNLCQENRLLLSP